MRGYGRLVVFAILSLLVASGTVFAQATSSLRGKVIDEQSGALPGVPVQLINADTSFERTVFSDESGAYQFLQVPPGTYEVLAELSGFAPYRAKVTLQVNTPASADLKLGLAGLSETVSVEAKIAPINFVDASVGNPFGETQVRQLPLLTRNVVELLSLQPGVTPTGEVIGARRDQNNITLDGVDINDNQTAGVEGTSNGQQGGLNTGQQRESGFNGALPVPLDSVQEFRVTVTGQNANQGRSSGGQVTLITKSGTNTLHGSAYEYNRDSKFAANSYFNERASLPKEQLKRNQYGASIGGPIVKNRVFFFGNVERRTDNSGQSVLRNVPSAALRSGTLMVRANNGQTYALGPDAIRAIDPLGLGSSPAMLALLGGLPAANDEAAGLDRGLNFAGYRFNAPFTLDNRAYVGKVDVKLDSMSKHNLSVRTTIADMEKDNVVAQYPGQDAASVALDNSYGVSAAYTSVLSAKLVNSLNVGLTNIRLKQTGSLDPSFTIDTIHVPTNFTRPFERNNPTWNIVEDLTWTKGSHSITTGGNLRFIRNERVNYANAFPSYSYGRGSLLGLASDITGATTSYLRNLTGIPTLGLADAAVVGRAFGNLLGVITTGSMTYTYDQAGNPIPVGTPAVRNFATNEYELYFADNWRATPNLTLTYGLRYVNYGVPYETSGLQVAPTFPLQDFFAQRIDAMAKGIPMNQMENALLSYDFNGPANGRQSWYGPDRNNFAPRVSAAYRPEDGFLSFLTGRNGVIRGGAGLVYDRFGSDLVTKFDNAASFGLSEIVRLDGQSVNFTTGRRYDGTLPAIPDAPPHTFPFTPPAVNFIGGNYMGIDTKLHAPYSINANFSIAREMKGGLTVEAGYVGRWSRDQLMQLDAGGWAINMLDPASGTTWKQAAQQIRGVWNSGVTPAQVRANPALIQDIPWIENWVPALKNLYFPGSATANYYDLIWGQFGGSDADTIHAIDRIQTAQFPNCIIRTGCFTMYPTQSSGMSMWTNAGYGDFNGLTLSVRKPISKGVSFDFNYTLARARDNGGSTESGGGNAGGLMLNPFDRDAFYGYSDFDVRHNVNSNVMVELPFGRGRRFLSGAGGLVDGLVGGWQLSTIFRYRSALPTAVAYSGLWPTNFSFTTLADPVGPYEAEVQINDRGNPAIFPTTNAAAANWKPMLPGEVGTRAAVRLDDFYNTDIALTKSFALGGGSRIQVRAEAFNAFNNVNFTRLNLDANAPNSFGQFTETTAPRVMQFAIRFEF
ncbi:MAG: carboxypeptidase regulatory-like domain-containing protein [Vicinamibacterales bacterium]